MPNRSVGLCVLSLLLYIFLFYFAIQLWLLMSELSRKVIGPLFGVFIVHNNNNSNKSANNRLLQIDAFKSYSPQFCQPSLSVSCSILSVSYTHLTLPTKRIV